MFALLLVAMQLMLLFVIIKIMNLVVAAQTHFQHQSQVVIVKLFVVVTQL
jgi:hypothetical protein